MKLPTWLKTTLDWLGTIGAFAWLPFAFGINIVELLTGWTGIGLLTTAVYVCAGIAGLSMLLKKFNIM